MVRQLYRYFAKILVLWVLIIGILLSAGGFYSAAARSNQTQPELDTGLFSYVKVISSSTESIMLEFTPPAPEITDAVIEAKTCQHVSISGLHNHAERGKPPLPIQGAMLGVPQGAQPSLEVLIAETTPLEGTFELCPTQNPILVQPSGREGISIPPYDNIEIIDAFLPAQAAALGETALIRHQAVTALQFHPLQYNSATGTLHYASRIRVEVNYNAQPQAAGMRTLPAEDPHFEDTYQELLLNYDQAKDWRLNADRSSEQGQQTRDSGVRYRIVIDQDGLYELNYTDLAAAGLPVDTLDPRTFQIFHQGEELAIWVVGESDGTFHADDAVLFYGQGINTKHTTENVYWLGFGEELGSRMSEEDGTPSGTADTPNEFLTTLHLEEDLVESPYDYYSDAPSGSDNDHLYWKTIWGIGENSINFELANLSALNHTLALKGLTRHYYSSPQPHLRLFINDNPTPIFDEQVSFSTDWNITASLQQADLVEGINTLTIETTSDYDNVLINRFKLDYYDSYFAENDVLFFDGDQAGTWEYAVDGFSTTAVQAYNLADPNAPVRITNPVITPTVNGFQLAFEDVIPAEVPYLAVTPNAHLSPLRISLDTASDWESPTNGADVIIISHSDFLSALQPLVDYRDGQGYRVALVDVQDVYDEFNGGVFSPDAIHSFLSYAYASWTAPAPAFVLLVGDGHWDYKDAAGSGTTLYMPPYLEDVDPWIGETATDNAYVCVSGTDNLPDMSIGRLPVSSVAEAQTMVQKILDYEQTPPVGGWNTKLTFVADDADGGGDYATISDQAIAILPPGYTSQKIYYKVNYNNPANARNALIAAINQGRFIVHYAGHASYTYWANSESSRLFGIADLSSLNNADVLPLMLPMTCLDGYFIWPGNASLGDSIVRKQGGGAIASFSPTGYGLTSGHSVLAESILENLTNAHYNQLGYLTTQAKYELYATLPSQGYLLDTYLLFGDPVLRLQLEPEAIEAPSGLSAQAVSSYQIDLSWTDNADTETAFLIERSPDGAAGWTQIGQVGANTTAYSNTGLDPNTTYHYRVRAYREGDLAYSSYSSTASDTTFELLNAPTALAATPITTEQINLSWEDNTASETAFVIDRSPDGANWTTIGQVEENVTTYDDTGLDPNTTYTYRVKAFRALDGQHSDYSNTAHGTTLPLPDTPTDLSAAPISVSQIDLAWNDNASDETAYRVERSPDGAAGWTEIADLGADATTYSNTGLTPGTQYYYRVRAYRAEDDQYSAYSNIANATTIALPVAPTNLTAAVVSVFQIDLSWTDNATDETAYRVERSPDGSAGWIEIAELGVDTTAYSDTGLNPGTVYFYRVRAYRSTDNQYSAYSNTVSAVTVPLPDPPTDLQAEPISISQIDLGWTDNAGDETGYRVERSPDGATGWEEIAVLEADTISYSDNGLDPGTPYYYRVRAHRASDDQYSTYSNITDAITIPLPETPTDLAATAVSVSQIDLGWTDNATDETAYRVERSLDGAAGWVEIDVLAANVTVFSDTGLDPGTTYFYRVRAYRGEDDIYSDYSNTSDATTIPLPAAPTALSATAISTSQINLTWTDNASDETAYRVERSPDGVTGWSEIADLGADSTAYSNIGLDPGTTYFYRVRAYRGGDDQYSDYSDTTDATTIALPETPTSLTGTTISISQINLAWTDNASDETAYRVERSSDGITGWTEIADLGADITGYSDTGLDPGTTYFYRVRAYRSGDGQFSGYSNTAEASTIAMPGTPTDLFAVAVSVSQINLSWTDTAVDETAYLVERSLSGAGDWVEIANLAMGTTAYSDSSLDPDTTYYYRVRAYRDGDDQYSDYSNVDHATTNGLPAKPTNLAASGISISQIDLIWVDNASDETAYRVERSPDGLTSWVEIANLDTNVTTYSDMGLDPGMAYFYRVRAYRAADEQYSDFSNTTSGTTIPLPAAPTELSASAVSISQIDLSWTDNAADETTYYIERSPDGLTGWVEIADLDADVTTYSDHDLDPDTVYFYRVYAYRSGDEQSSGFSNTASATTYRLLEAPTNLLAAAVSVSQIDLTWSDNAIDETAYRVERSLDGAGGWTEITEVGADVTTYSDTGLTPETTYFYRVRAYRAADNHYSIYSEIAFAVTFPLPVAPTSLTAAAISISQIDLAWTDNAVDETDYHIERSPDGFTGWLQIAELDANATTYSDTGLDPNTTYHYRVLAYRDSDGQFSDFSNTASAATYRLLDAPTNLQASAVSISQIDLTWTDNAFDETAYQVERSPNGATGWLEIAELAGDATNYSDSNLAPGTTYYYRVQAYRIEDGELSGYSNLAEATTIPLPATPTDLTAEAVSISKVDLIWTDQAVDETSYLVERSLNPDTGWVEIAVLGADVSAYSDTLLIPDTRYFYRVRAYREGDDQYSAYSNTTSARTIGLPAPPTELTAEAVSISQINLSWTDNAADETAYHIERRLDGSVEWLQIADLTEDTTTFSDMGLDPGTTYHYRVRAYREDDEQYSNFSNPAFAATTPLPAAPTNLTATAVSVFQIDLIWTDHAVDETAYIIERSSGEALLWVQIAAVDADVFTFSDSDLEPYTSYHYRVCAYREDDGQYSEYSNSAQAKSTAPYQIFMPLVKH